MKFEDFLNSASNQKIHIVSVVVPDVVMNWLDKTAVKNKISTGAFVNQIFTNAIKKMAEEDPSLGE